MQIILDSDKADRVMIDYPDNALVQNWCSLIIIIYYTDPGLSSPRNPNRQPCKLPKYTFGAHFLQ